MHILVAEDNIVNRKLIQKIFNKLFAADCTISIVENGQQALDYLAAPPSVCPRPDIILMDTSMPVLDGLSATRTLRTQPPFVSDPSISSTPIIAMFPGLVHPQVKDQFRSQGFDDWISKPLRPVHLRKLILHWSARRVVPRGGRELAVPTLGNVVPVRPGVAWGMPLRRFKGPRSLL